MVGDPAAVAEVVDLGWEEGKRHHQIVVVGIEVVAFPFLGLVVGNRLRWLEGREGGREVRRLEEPFVVEGRYLLPLVGRLIVSVALTRMGAVGRVRAI